MGRISFALGVVVAGTACIGCRAVLGIEDLPLEQVVTSPDGGGGAAGSPAGSGGDDGGRHGDGCGGALWSKSFRVDAPIYGEPNMALDYADRIVLAGLFKKAIQLDGFVSDAIGDEDGYVAKLDATGNVQWAKFFGVVGGRVFTPLVAVTPSGNVAIAATLNGDAIVATYPCAGATNHSFVALFDGDDGEPLWLRCAGVSGSMYHGGLTVTDDAIILSGGFAGTLMLGTSTATTDSSDGDPFVARIAMTDGTVTKLHHLGKGGAYGASNVLVGSRGDLTVSGNFTGTETFVTGQTVTSSAADDTDLFLLRFDEQRSRGWARRFGTSASEAASYLRSDAAGNALLVGGFVLGADGTPSDLGGGPLEAADCPPTTFDASFLLALDPSGEHAASRSFPTCVWPLAAELEPTGNVVAAGGFDKQIQLGGAALTSTGGTDIFFARYDAKLNHLCSRSFGGATTDKAASLVVDSAGNAVVAGSFSQVVDLGAGPLEVPAPETSRVFLAKLPAP